MNVLSTLRGISWQLQSCFYKDRKLAARIIIFLFTGMVALWLFICECVLLWVIRLLQIVGEECKLFIKNERFSSSVRCVFMLICAPIMYMTFVALPFMYMPLWANNFFFNCFAYITSLGKSGWKEPVFE